MPLKKLVRSAALFWGLVVCMPVGMNYFAFFALAACMLLQGGRLERVRRVRGHPLFWPLVFYVAWTALVLVLQPRLYAETASNLWHGGRIVATLLLALALTREEAVWAAGGFVLAVVYGVLVIVLHQTVGLPELPVWRNLVSYSGNKSISNAILMALLAGSALVLALVSTGRSRWVCDGVALILLAVVVVALPNRTAQLLVLCALPAAAVHQWRGHKRKLVVVVALAVLASAAFVAAVPTVRERLAQGVQEIRQGSEGEVAMASWNLRVQMIRHTSRMVFERPWMGWGIGAWNDQWRKRVPPLIADLNMPHNDLLWMGAQAGVPGALAWLAIMLAACRVGWTRQDLIGRLAFVAALTLLLSALVNSATRDAVIGLGLLWVVGVYLRLAADPGFRVRFPGVARTPGAPDA